MGGQFEQYLEETAPRLRRHDQMVFVRRHLRRGCPDKGSSQTEPRDESVGPWESAPGARRGLAAALRRPTPRSHVRGPSHSKPGPCRARGPQHRWRRGAVQHLRQEGCRTEADRNARLAPHAERVGRSSPHAQPPGLESLAAMPQKGKRGSSTSSAASLDEGEGFARNTGASLGRSNPAPLPPPCGRRNS